MLYQGEHDEAKTRNAIDTSREQLVDLDIGKLSTQEISAYQGMMKEVIIPLMHPFACLEINTGVTEDYNVVLTSPCMSNQRKKKENKEWKEETEKENN